MSESSPGTCLARTTEAEKKEAEEEAEGRVKRGGRKENN